MSDRTAFLRNIAVHRFHTLPRLVYADWLDEHGPDQPADARRAELIRLANDVAALPPESHKPAAECDCDRCRMTRRHTEMTDAGIRNWDAMPSGSFRLGGLITEGGFPVRTNLTALMPIADTRVGFEVAAFFREWPLVNLQAVFSDPAPDWRRRLTVAIDPDPDGGRPIVGVSVVPEYLDPLAPVGSRQVASEPYISQDQLAAYEYVAARSPEEATVVVRKTVKKVLRQRRTDYRG